VPTRHAWAVQQLLDAGATLIGKTITDEVSLGILGENPFDGTPLNPKAPDRVPGGSSSGSASAVAQGSATPRSAPTAAARCACPPASAASTASGPRTAGSISAGCWSRRRAPTPLDGSRGREHVRAVS
jgi:hypothetical protein